MIMPNILAAIRGWVSKLARIGKSAFGKDKDMVRIRLRRQGSKGQPSYRIVVIDQRRARNGKYLENIGHYNPRTRPVTEIIKEDRALYWLSVGAQPSDAVRRIMDHTGTWERFQRLRAGENIEALIKEAEENRDELPSPTTNYPAPRDGESKIKAREAKRLSDEESKGNRDERSAQLQEELTTDNQTPDGPNNLEKQHEEIQNTDPKTSDLYSNLNRPGKIKLNEDFIEPIPLRAPIDRAKRKKKLIEEAIRVEPDISKRTRQVLTKRWEGKDPATREFLKQQYNGRCQICNCTCPKHDGEPYFEGLYIESYKEAKWLDDPANVLCLCANHCAQFLHGARVFTPDFREQVMSFENDDYHILKVTLIGKDQKIRFSQRHIVDLKAIVEVTKNN